MSFTPQHQASNADQNRWFAEQILPHESGPRAHLRNSFPSPGDADDVVQESFLRVLRAKVAGKLRSPKGLLFKAARTAAIDVFRRNRTISLDALVEADSFAVHADGPAASESASQHEEIDLLIEAIECLPRRCRQVLKLRKIDGLSHREIARRLGISERTVNVQVGKGVKRCADYLEGRIAAAARPQAACQQIANTSDHGSS